MDEYKMAIQLSDWLNFKTWHKIQYTALLDFKP
jgi:hypothetical protein